MAAFGRGFGFYLQGFSFLKQPGIRRLVLLPLLLNALLFGALIWLAGLWFTDFMDAAGNVLPAWLSWLQAVLWLLFALAAGCIVLFTFMALGSLLAAPFNSLLAEAVELQLTGQRLPSNPWPRMLARLPRTLVQETMKLLYFGFWACVFLLLFLIPLVNLAAPLLWLLFAAWMAALDASDYPMDNHELPFKEMRRRLWLNLPMAMGFGTAMLLVLAVPLLNLVAMPTAVCGATLMWVEHLREVAPAGRPS